MLPRYVLQLNFTITPIMIMTMTTFILYLKTTGTITAAAQSTTAGRTPSDVPLPPLTVGTTEPPLPRANDQAHPFDD